MTAEKKLSAKEKIKLCFLESLQSKAIAAISVTEICRAAAINRATFYKHYLDVYDLMESLENEILEQLKEHLTECGQDDYDEYENMTCRMVSYLGNMDRRYWVLFAPERGGNLATRAFELLNHTAFPVLQSRLPEMQPEKAEMLYHYISMGFSGIISHWLSREKKMPAQEVAKIILQFCIATIDGVI